MDSTGQRVSRVKAIGMLGLWLVAAAGSGRAEAQQLRPVGPQITVALSQEPRVSSAQVGVFPDGGFVVAWTVWLTQFTAGPTLINARFFNRDGSPRTDVINLLSPSNQRIDDLKVTPDGGFWLLWDQLRNTRTSVLVRRYDRGGAPMTPPLLVHSPSTASRFGTALGVGADGGMVVGWVAEQPSPVFFPEDTVVRFFAPDGTPRSPEVNLSSFGNSLSFVSGIAVEADGSAWMAGSGEGLSVLVQHVSASGQADQPIDACQDSPACAEGRDPDNFAPVLAMRPDGVFMLAWEHITLETDNFPSPLSIILGRTFNGDGSPRGDVFQVNSHRNIEKDPLLTALPDGRMVALWSDVASNTTLLGVFCRTFDADGTPAGREFALGQLPPESLAAGADGSVVAVFDYFAPPSSQGFAARRLAGR